MLGPLYRLTRNMNFWRVAVFQLCTMFTIFQWRITGALLPKYLVRFYGTGVLWGAVNSVNLWLCTFFPPLFGILLAHRSDMGATMPGIFLFSMSSIFMVFSPTFE